MTERSSPEDGPDPREEAMEGSAEPAQPEADEAEVHAELEEALREKDQFRTMALRAQADLENYKRRAAEERGEAVRSAEDRLFLRVLQIVDDLERALSLVPEDAVAPGWLDGLRLVERNVAAMLDSRGISKIEPLGLPFEPFECEAVFYDESAEEAEGTVTRIVRDGYRQGDRLLRAAQVVVAKKTETKQDADEAQEEPDA